MPKKQCFLLAVFVLLGVVYVCVFTSWFKHPTMQISSAAGARANAGVRVKAGSINTAIVTFRLDRPYKLTEIKVVLLADWQTNKSAAPLWHLISDSNSIPIKAFPYGLAIRGMKPFASGAWPRPLEPNVTYRLFLTAGSIKGQHDFSAPPKK